MQTRSYQTGIRALKKIKLSDETGDQRERRSYLRLSRAGRPTIRGYVLRRVCLESKCQKPNAIVATVQCPEKESSLSLL